MNLTNEIKVTELFKGTTKFDFWKNLEVGDTLVVGLNLKPTGQNRRKIYAPDLFISNYRTGEKFIDTINSIQKYLSKIKYK